jgi:hypothetical protein
MGALTPINQNAIKQGKCGNLERDQTERDKSERDKAHISADPDFAQTDFAQTELAKNHVLQIWNPINQNLECDQTTTQLRRKAEETLEIARERERDRERERERCRTREKRECDKSR